jgi:hypothetical protein
MNVKGLTGVAAAVAGLALFAAGPGRAASVSQARSIERIAVSTPTASATVDQYYHRHWRNRWHHHYYYRSHVYAAPGFVVTTPAPYYRPGWYWHENHWYQHRRWQGGVWFYF